MGKSSPLWPSCDPLIVELRDAGVATRDIAHCVGTSKNAVIGRLHRLGKSEPGVLSHDSFFWRCHDPVARAMRAEGKSLAVIGSCLGRTAKAVSDRFSRLDAREGSRPMPAEGRPAWWLDWPPGGHCVFPIGHPSQPGFTFCRAETAPGRDYCEAHHQLTHIVRPVKGENIDE